MILAIDAGNTNLLFGLSEDGQWKHQWRIATDAQFPEVIWANRLFEVLDLAYMEATGISGVVISSVVPQLNDKLIQVFQEVLGLEPLLIHHSIYQYLDVEMLNPTQIGTDLVANAIAAHETFKQACIIVDFGTALTFTTISEEAKIVGVAIAPGMKTAIRSLFHHTAQLPEVPLEIPTSVLGKNTEHAIQAGVVVGYAGMVKYMVESIKKEMNVPMKVLATGGLSFVLQSLDEVFDAVNRDLTLDGLLHIYQQVNGKITK